MQSASEITASATAWLIRLEREATPELWEELQQWLDSHPRHRAEFIRQRTAWNRCDKLKILRPDNGTIDADLLAKIELVEPEESRASQAAGKLPARGRRPSAVDLSRRGWLAAAAITGLAILGASYLAFQDGWHTYVTAIGGRKQIALSDGSTVTLNTDSEMRVRIGSGRRDIVLMRGEALFHVAHDTQRPFLVTAETTIVRAVGTAFSVRIRADNQVDVLVTEGRVAVGAPEDGAAFTLSTASAVSAGEGAAVRHGKVNVKSLHPDEMKRKLAWTDPSGPRLWFQGETLAEAVAEFNRYNVRHLVIADPAIADPSVLQISFGGSISATDIDSFVDALKLFHVIVGSADATEVRLIADPAATEGATIAPLEEPAGVSSNHAAARAGDR